MGFLIIGNTKFLFIFSEDGETDDNLEDEGDEVEDISLDCSRPESFCVLVMNISSLAIEAFEDEDDGVGEITGNCLSLKIELPDDGLSVKFVNV